MLLALASLGLAADPVDLGVLKNSDLRVVQKLLYVKEKRSEIGIHLGVMPFDGWTVAPQLAATGVLHTSESIGLEAQLGVGYGLTNANYNLLAGEVYGVAVEAYRYLASAELDLQYTPIYAKMNLGKRGILHHDVYFLIGAGATVEQSVLPGAQIVVAPTLPLGIGTRIWLGPNTALRAELRDNLMVETRVVSDTVEFKQNAAVTLGLAFFRKGQEVIALLVTMAWAKPADPPPEPPVAVLTEKDKAKAEAARIEAFAEYTSQLATGQKARSADALLALVDDPARALYHAEAYAKLGALLGEMDLPYGALCAYVRAFDLASVADIEIVGLEVPKAIAHAERVGDAALLEGPFSKNLGLARTEDVRGKMAYMAAREAFRRQSYGLALGLLKVVKDGDPQNPEARMLEAVILNQQGRAEEALKPLEKAYVSGRDEGDRFRDLVALNTGRTWFGAGNFAKAIQFYAAVRRESDLWPQAQYERAWAHFRVEDLNGALAVLYSLNSPFFADWYLPEADLLRIYSMFLMCKFPEADTEIGAFRTYWGPVHGTLKAWSAKSERDNFELVRAWTAKEDSGDLPRMFLRPWGTEERMRAAIQAYESGEDEIRRMKKGAAANPFTERAQTWVTERMDELVAKEGGRVKARIAGQEEQIGQMMADTEIFGLDILRMKAQLYEQAANLGKMEEAARYIERKERVRKGWREWPFEGEIWADELGYYRVSAVPECPASMRKESLQ